MSLPLVCSTSRVHSLTQTLGACGWSPMRQLVTTDSRWWVLARREPPVDRGTDSTRSLTSTSRRLNDPSGRLHSQSHSTSFLCVQLATFPNACRFDRRTFRIRCKRLSRVLGNLVPSRSSSHLRRHPTSPILDFSRVGVIGLQLSGKYSDIRRPV